MRIREKSSIAMGSLAILCLLVASSSGAYAYIDPGTGSYVLQVVAASVLAAAFVIKSTWRNIKGAISRRLGKRRADD